MSTKLSTGATTRDSQVKNRNMAEATGLQHQKSTEGDKKSDEWLYEMIDSMIIQSDRYHSSMSAFVKSGLIKDRQDVEEAINKIEVSIHELRDAKGRLSDTTSEDQASQTAHWFEELIPPGSSWEKLVELYILENKSSWKKKLRGFIVSVRGAMGRLVETNKLCIFTGTSSQYTKADPYSKNCELIIDIIPFEALLIPVTTAQDVQTP
ncbi:hypothetical protein SBOR_2532 [Sclerotinia borealis F-4128]|uniref:Uncharacterized protein n=1 Tax=Sclerotinia borealis (strain F-4128) TaxID=1432307 RepID=W9CJX6_SCLBF|nr:hypothetical protein SBOR_2532 [Sclerotinia borealis F-4128]